jgi:hypothetical protein
MVVSIQAVCSQLVNQGQLLCSGEVEETRNLRLPMVGIPRQRNLAQLLDRISRKPTAQDPSSGPLEHNLQNAIAITRGQQFSCFVLCRPIDA